MQGLVSRDKHTRKLAKHSKCHGTNPLCLDCPWDLYWQIYDAAEEYSGHLLKSLIGQISGLSNCTRAAIPRSQCLENELVSLLVKRVMSHENDSVVKHAVSAFTSSDIVPAGVSVFSIIQGMERTPAVFQNKDEVFRISEFLKKFVRKSNDINLFTKYVLEEAKPYFPISFCYLEALSGITGLDPAVLLPSAKVYLEVRIGAFQTVLRPSLISLLKKTVFNEAVIASCDSKVFPILLEIVYMLDSNTHSLMLEVKAHEFLTSTCLADSAELASIVSLESLRGAAIVLENNESVIRQIRETLCSVRDRPYLSGGRKQNLTLLCMAFAHQLDTRDIECVVDFRDPKNLAVLLELRSSINTEIDFSSKLRDFMRRANELSDHEIFEIGYLLALALRSDKLKSADLLEELLQFSAPRVSPYFQSPSVHGLSTREQIHDSFFASKWRLLEKSVNGFLVVSGEQIVDHINASGVTTLGDLLAFVNTLLVNNKFDDREWLLKTFISESAFGLLSEKNEENIEAILRIVFFDNSLAEDITGLMRKIVKLPTPNVARTTIPSFVAMLKHLEKGAISMSMIAFLAELVVHKEPFDETSIEGFVFGSFALSDFELSFEDKFRPSAAFMRIVMLVALKELNNTEITNALVSILLEKIIEYQEFIIARKAPQTPLPFTPFHQMQLRVYQALCYWAPLIDEQTFKSVIEPVLFGPLLIWSNQPDARDYLESLAIYFLLKFHGPLDRLISVLNDFSLSSQAVASFVVIGGYLASYPGNVPQRQELMLALLPFLSSNIAYIRGVSQMWLHDADSQNLLPKDWVMIQSMLRFVQSNKESVQMRGKLKPVYAIWDPVHAIESGEILTLSSLIRNAELVPSRVFIDAVREGVHEALQNNWFYTRDLDSVIDEARTEIVNEKERIESNIGGKVNSQKKYAPPVTDMFPDALEEELKQNRRAETELVVVTSLLEKSTNIAGLCRTAEVFGAAKLIVPTMHVLEDPQFSSMSVTAEQWIDIEEVPESSLESFLIEMKAKGYTVVCLEQTHDSVPIQEYDFANSKTCLVLGNEKNGVPVPLLPLMDVCVEIPQRGVIRSLNVHVSGALAMWQYNMHR